MRYIDISVVIVNYNVKDLLLTCLETLYKFVPAQISIETIVVDNNSSDDSCTAIKNHYPEVILIENKENVGFPKANNQGFDIAKGEYIFMLNPDTEFIEDSVSKLVDYLRANKDVDVIAPMLLNTDRSRQLSVWKYPNLWSIFCETHYLHFLLKKKNYLDKEIDKPFIAESFSGAAILFRRSVFDEIGQLDESMFWIEDVDFCYRATEKKLKCIYFPGTKIIHHIGQSAKKNYNISICNQVVNKIKFFKKHYSKFSWMIVVLLSFYHVLLKFVIFGLLSPLNKIYYRKSKAYVYTLKRVFNPPMGMN